jgi:hypothetical protein
MQINSSTNKIKEIKLTSTIEQVSWTKNIAAAGGKIGIDVFTKYVGNNSDIKIEIKDKNGKSGGTVKGKISGNRFWKNIDVPENLEDELTAIVKLSKQGLEKKSNTIPLLPPVKISNLKWNQDEAKRGDILKLTADVKGSYDGAEATIEIYEHDNDGAHDLVVSFPTLVKSQKIKTEWEFQYVEDTNDIPTHDEAENGYQNPEYFFRVNIGGISEDSGLLKFKDWVELEWVYDNETPVENKKLKLITADGSEREETVNDQGKLRLENLSPGPFQILIDEDDSESESEESTSEEETIKVILKDHNDNPYSNKKYEIKYDSNTISGSTSGDGLIEKQIPAYVQEAELFVWLDDNDNASYCTVLRFEEFEPANSPKGIQKKLQNLGYYPGKIDGDLGPMTKDAINNFQKSNNLTVTGEINSEFAEKVNKKFINK